MIRLTSGRSALLWRVLARNPCGPRFNPTLTAPLASFGQFHSGELHGLGLLHPRLPCPADNAERQHDESKAHEGGCAAQFPLPHQILQRLATDERGHHDVPRARLTGLIERDRQCP